MSLDDTKEKRFESDIEASLITEGGYAKGSGAYDTRYALYADKLLAFIKETQPKEWTRFEKMNPINTEEKFCQAFSDSVESFGMLEVLRKGSLVL